MHRAVYRYISIPILALLLASTSFGQSTLPPTQPLPQTQPANKAPAPQTPAAEAPSDDPEAVDMSGEGALSISEVPQLETEELVIERAKKALDTLALVSVKYKESALDDYIDLQEFVDKDIKGKDFEADIKTFGFTSVNDWNLAVTSLSVAYNNIINDQTEDTQQQIADIEKSVDMAQDMKDVAIKTLKASIPSVGNTKVASDLIADKDYAEKIKLLEATEE